MSEGCSAQNTNERVGYCLSVKFVHHPNAPYTAEIQCKNKKMSPALPESADWAHICAGFNRTNLWGVQSDSLESFETVGEGQVGYTLVLCTFFARARQQLFYMYCNGLIYIIYNVFYYICEFPVRRVVG